MNWKVDSLRRGSPLIDYISFSLIASLEISRVEEASKALDCSIKVINSQIDYFIDLYLSLLKLEYY